MDISTAYEKMVLITEDASNVKDGMSALLDYCAKVCPCEAWNELRAVDFDGDVNMLQHWLENLLTMEPPSHDVKAYWFGLFTPLIEKEMTCALYVCGLTAGYDPDDDGWNCWMDDTYLPNGRYADSRALKLLYRRLLQEKNDDLCAFAEYALCLGYACLAVPRVMRSLDVKLLLGDADERTVVTGFDDGDEVLLGTVSRAGWLPA